MPEADMSVVEALRDDLMSAVRRRDHIEVRVIRNLIAAIGNAESRPDVHPPPTVGTSNDVERRVLTEEDIEAVSRAERRDMLDAAAQFEKAGRPDRADALRVASSVVERYLDRE